MGAAAAAAAAPGTFRSGDEWQVQQSPDRHVSLLGASSVMRRLGLATWLASPDACRPGEWSEARQGGERGVRWPGRESSEERERAALLFMAGCRECARYVVAAASWKGERRTARPLKISDLALAPPAALPPLTSTASLVMDSPLLPIASYRLAANGFFLASSSRPATPHAASSGGGAGGTDMWREAAGAAAGAAAFGLYRRSARLQACNEFRGLLSRGEGGCGTLTRVPGDGGPAQGALCTAAGTW